MTSPDRRLRVAVVFAALAIAAAAAPADRPAAAAGERMASGSLAPLAEQAAPAVVNIFARKLLRSPGVPRALGDSALWRLFSDALLFSYGARDRVENSLGSGVIVASDGIVVTNHHVIADARDIFVVLADDRVVPAEIILSDAGTDLAVLRATIPGEALPVLEFADSDRLVVGDLVLAIGNPFGLGQSVTSGIISALPRSSRGIGDFRFFIQTDAAINPGNSGGALIAADGRLIGVNTAIISRGGGSVGVGFAIPANMVRAVVDAALSGRPLARPWIGVLGIRTPPHIAFMMGLPRPMGVLVTAVHAGGPAAAAGIEPGDVIVAVGDLAVDDFAMMRYRVAMRPRGAAAQLTILRHGTRLEIDVQPAPPPDTPPRQDTRLGGLHVLAGALVANLSPAFADELGLETVTDGVAVLHVRRGSSAARRGLRAGDIIQAFQGERIDTIAALRAIAIPPLAPWRLIVSRAGRPIALGSR